MRISTAIPALPRSVREALGNDVAAELYAWVEGLQTQTIEALNGGLEMTENMGIEVDDTFDSAANTTQVFVHGLGRLPAFFVWRWDATVADLTGYATYPEVYCPPVVWAARTTDAIGLLCTEDTTGTPLGVRVWVF